MLQDTAEDLDRGLKLFRHHLIGARLAQVVDFTQVAGPGNDMESWVQLARHLDRPPGGDRIGNRQYQRARLVDPQTAKHLRVRDISEVNRHAFLLLLPNGLPEARST